MEVPCWQARKPSSRAGQSISRASSVTEAMCRSLHQPIFPKWTWSWSWMTDTFLKRSGKPQCSWGWASHLALMAFQQNSIIRGKKQCSISSRICSPTVGGGEGGRDSIAGPQGRGHCLCKKKKKKKGEQPDCSNYQGIFLLSTDGRILACVLLNRFILR